MNLIFEGESLFNDGTAIALFLIVLAVVESHASAGVPVGEHLSLFKDFFASVGPSLGGLRTVAEGLVTFASMI